MDNLAISPFSQAQIAAGSAAQGNIAEKAKNITNFADMLKGTNLENAAHNLQKSVSNKKEIDSQIKKAAADFEAVFLSEMLGPVFEKLEVDSMFGGGHGEQMYRSMLVQEYGKQLAKNGGVGIQDVLISQMQEYQKGVQ